MKQIIKHSPEVIVQIREIEEEVGRTYFSVGYIPEWASTKRDEKSGRMCPTIDDVVKYVSDRNQLTMFDDSESSCMSYYNVCEM